MSTGLSIHRIKRGVASDESYFREVQTLQMELQQIMKGTELFHVNKKNHLANNISCKP